MQTIFGGTISIYKELYEPACADAFIEMMQHADQFGANAIMRPDANQVMNGVTEVLAYGTAVRMEKL